MDGRAEVDDGWLAAALDPHAPSDPAAPMGEEGEDDEGIESDEVARAAMAAMLRRTHPRTAEAVAEGLLDAESVYVICDVMVRVREVAGPDAATVAATEQLLAVHARTVSVPGLRELGARLLAELRTPDAPAGGPLPPATPAPTTPAAATGPTAPSRRRPPPRLRFRRARRRSGPDAPRTSPRPTPRSRPRPVRSSAHGPAPARGPPTEPARGRRPPYRRRRGLTAGRLEPRGRARHAVDPTVVHHAGSPG